MRPVRFEQRVENGFCSPEIARQRVAERRGKRVLIAAGKRRARSETFVGLDRLHQSCDVLGGRAAQGKRFRAVACDAAADLRNGSAR